MGKVFINPNFHVILVHFPLGIFLLGVVIELLSFMYRRSGLRVAGRWMILLGALATIPTAFSGIYALNDIAVRSQADGRPPADNATWAQVASGALLRDGRSAASPGIHLAGMSSHEPRSAETDEIWRVLSRHVWIEGSASALIALVAVFYLGLSDLMRRRMYLPCVILLVGGAALMSWGAWYAGESIYRFGAATRLEKSAPASSTAELPGATSSAIATPTTAPSASLAVPSSNWTSGMNGLPQIPPYLMLASIELSPTSEPSTEPTTGPSTAPTTAPTTEPTTAPAPAPPALATEPAPVTTQPPATAPAPEPTPPPATTAPDTTPTTAPTTAPAVTLPPPTVPPAGIIPQPLLPATTPITTGVPSTLTVPVIQAPPIAREPEVDKTEVIGTPAYYVGPPLQVHVLLAGFAAAFALAALGASMRRLALLAPSAVPVTEAEAALEAEETEAALAATNAPGHRPVTGQDIDLARSFNPDLALGGVRTEYIPASRLWLLVFLIALLTASAGIYLLAAPRSLGGDGIGLNTNVLWGVISDKTQNPDGPVTRRLAHVIGGGSMLLLPLLLAIFARWSRSRLVVGIFSLLLVLLFAAQVWIGILLLYDTNVGKINHFNIGPVTTPHVQNPQA